MTTSFPFDQETADGICVALSQGKSLRTITQDDQMPSMTTVFKWLRENEHFAQQYALAREAQADSLADEIVQIADGEEKDADPQRDRLRVDARKWVASKLKPKKYGDKIDVTTDGERVSMDETAIATRIASLLRTGLERDGSV